MVSGSAWKKTYRGWRYKVNYFQIRTKDKDGNVKSGPSNCFGYSTLTCQQNLNTIVLEMLEEKKDALTKTKKLHQKKVDEVQDEIARLVTSSKFVINSPDDANKMRGDERFRQFAATLAKLTKKKKAREGLLALTVSMIDRVDKETDKFMEIQSMFTNDYDEDKINMNEHMQSMITFLDSQGNSSNALTSSESDRTAVLLDIKMESRRDNMTEMTTFDSSENDNDLAEALKMLLSPPPKAKTTSAQSAHSAVMLDDGRGVSTHDLGNCEPDDDTDEIILTMSSVPGKISNQKTGMKYTRSVQNGLGV